MGSALTRQAILVGGRAIPVLAVAGPSGTGKSVVASSIALMITRAEGGPNVLLVDADLYNRGLTAQIETSMPISCGYLHDVIVGRNPKVQPALIYPDQPPPGELTGQRLWPAEWLPLVGEGSVFFLPSARSEADNPWMPVATLDLTELSKLIRGALGSAALASGADCIVADTTSIPEPCSSVLASVADLLFMVGSQDKLRDFLDPADRGRVEVILNQVDNVPAEFGVSGSPVSSHFIPGLANLGKNDEQGLVDRIRLASSVGGILSDTLRLTHPQLLPPWHAALPREWRWVARAVARSPLRLSALYPHFAALASAISVAWSASLLLTLLTWEAGRQVSAGAAGLLALGPAIGIALVAVCAALTVWIGRDVLKCVVATSKLAQGDLRWVLGRLSLRERELRTRSPKYRQEKIRRRVRSLQRVFAALRRASEASPNSTLERSQA